MTKQDFLYITHQHIFYTIFSISQYKLFCPLKKILKISPHLHTRWWMFYIHRLRNPQNILQTVQCILWGTQDRTYNSTCDQQIINCCLYYWYIPVILVHAISREQNSIAYPVSMTLWSKRIAYATADEDLAIVSMVTYRTLVPAQMSVLWVVLFQKDSI
jgi:hypothetical protein